MTEETAALCTTPPKQKFSEKLTDSSVNIGLFHDRGTGITYFDVKDNHYPRLHLICYTTHLGAEPNLLIFGGNNIFQVSDDSVFNRDRRADRLEVGGD